MKKGIAVSLALALLLSLMLFAPGTDAQETASNTTPEQALKEAFHAFSALDSVHLDVGASVDMSMLLSYDDQTIRMPMNTVAAFDVLYQKKPLRLQGQLKLNVDSVEQFQNKSVLFYIEQQNRVALAYTSKNNGDSWTVRRAKTGMLFPLDSASLISACFQQVQAAGQADVGGRKAQIYSCKLNGRFLRQVMEITGALRSLSRLMGEGKTLQERIEQCDVDIAIYVDEETHLPLRITMDTTACMKDILGGILQSILEKQKQDGMDIGLDIMASKVDGFFYDFNHVPPIEIPEAAKAAAGS